jgi:hypothetical protein
MTPFTLCKNFFFLDGRLTVLKFPTVVAKSISQDLKEKKETLAL